MMRISGFLGVVAGVVFAMPAAATQWLSDNATAATSPSACTTGVGGTTGLPAGTTNGAQACQMTVTVGSGASAQTLKVRAYSTRTADQSQSSLLRSAQIQLYGGGFAVTNVVSSDTGEGVQPEHALDNNQAFDVLVFELPSAGFDIEAFQLGWAQEGTTANKADVQTWFGGNTLGGDYNFSNVCFNSCTGTGTTTLAAAGFTDITGTMKIAGTSVNGSDIPIDTQVDLTGVQSGRYLVVAGRLGDTNDYFKVDSIKALTGTAGSAPIPGTLALFGLGLFGLVSRRKRPASA